jgi:DNA-binding LacI/PurR family transcriptional regulator
MLASTRQARHRDICFHRFMNLTTPRDGKAKQPEYRRIADGLRTQILGGKWKPGVQLPATGKLATSWKTSYCTIHTALQSLVREGWIERIRGAGTYVADPKTRFTSAGIYHSFDIGSNEDSPFGRSIQAALLRQLEKSHQDGQIFIDPRPYEKQGIVLPALAEAILHRRIQCVIAPTINSMDEAWLAKLPVPTAFLSSSLSLNRVDFANENLFTESLRRLAAKGCRSVGLISGVTAYTAKDNSPDPYHASFLQAVRQAGLVTRDDWIRRPPGFTRALLDVGYREFHAIWRRAEKPDGLIVYPDLAASGAITAILETGFRSVTERMKFVFHRNAHLPFLCPFPVTWAVSDEDKLADGLVNVIREQFAGTPVAPRYLDHDFIEGPSPSLAHAD